MFSVGKRIGIGYLLMAVLLVGMGAAGLLAADRIGDALNRITGPVDATVRAVDKGIRGVLQQMIGVDMALSARPEKAQEQISAGSELSKNYDKYAKVDEIIKEILCGKGSCPIF